ncbi:D-2-hydroxyacid dehydrogenase family protein [Xanthomonas albilineans]|uniref:D-2-hydroxyacid dehydrogenase family protein n=1 Tax=Xanthomonas albilineans TaxID=29447 RepID=UPI0005F3291F|nr:D-2-hydroxyacid dehydrogenase family protein [Xanthomonas albilineans]
MRILVVDDYQDAVRHLSCFHRLLGHRVQVLTAPSPDPDTLVRHAGEAEALVLIRERTRIDTALLARLPSLRLISQTGRIGEHIDLAACTTRGVAVAEGVGSPVAPAELTWALLMAASRRLPAYRDALLTGRWQATGDAGLGRSLEGLTLGVWSYGKIGRRVAAYGRAFGMRVQVWGGEDTCAHARADGFEIAASRAALFADSDVLSLHRRLVAATRHQIVLDDLLRMKPDALLVNTSRAELLAPGVLLAALAAGHPGQAALDVFEQEPLLDPQHPLLRHPQVLATPHLGYVEQSSYELYFGAAFDNVLAFAAGAPQHLANPEVLTQG